jgi:hypothetical protein
VIYAFTLTAGSNYSVTAELVNMSADLDIFLLASGGCDAGQCLDAGSYGDARAVAGNVPPGTYYAAVDGYQGATGAFELQLNCTPTGGGCTPVSNVTIAGPSTGQVGVALCLTATVAPPDATAPISYTWVPAGTGQGTPNACFTWPAPGTYTVTVDVSNCSGQGTATDSHVVTIVDSCTPVVGVNINGPTSGLVNVPNGFSADVTPANASTPITFNWTPGPGSGQGTANVVYTWGTVGTFGISVTASNCSGQGTASDGHTIVISAGTIHRIFLPILHKE